MHTKAAVGSQRWANLGSSRQSRWVRAGGVRASAGELTARPRETVVVSPARRMAKLTIGELVNARKLKLHTQVRPTVRFTMLAPSLLHLGAPNKGPRLPLSAALDARWGDPRSHHLRARPGGVQRQISVWYLGPDDRRTEVPRRPTDRPTGAANVSLAVSRWADVVWASLCAQHSRKSHRGESPSSLTITWVTG